MFIVFLRFAENKAMAAEYMEAHKAWIEKGLSEGVFFVVGSLKPNGGGCIFAQESEIKLLEKRVHEDPFVEQNIVDAEIIEIEPSKVDERINFLMK